MRDIFCNKAKVYRKNKKQKLKKEKRICGKSQRLRGTNNRTSLKLYAEMAAYMWLKQTTNKKPFSKS